MKIISPITIFGFDLFSLIGQKNPQPGSTNILGGISLLQSFKYFVTNLGVKKHYESEAELVQTESELEEIGGVFAKRIVEDHIISTTGHKVSQDIVREIAKDTFIQIPQTSIPPTYSETDVLSGFMEIPQDIFDLLAKNEYSHNQAEASLE